MLTDAHFSLDNKYRYWLLRRWDHELPQFTYFLLNPSTASANESDATVTKLINVTKANGGGGFELINLFATVDTKQVGLHIPSAIGEDNDHWTRTVVERSTKLVLGWGDGDGNGPNAASRQAAVLSRARAVWPLVSSRDLWCFRKIASQAPGHPGRLGNDHQIVRYRPYRYPVKVK